MEICSVDLDDAGEYLCTASNGNSSVSATNATTLTVLPVGVTLSDTVTMAGTYDARMVYWHSDIVVQR